MPRQSRSTIPAGRKPRHLLSQRQLQRIAAARRKINEPNLPNIGPASTTLLGISTECQSNKFNRSDELPGGEGELENGNDEVIPEEDDELWETESEELSNNREEHLNCLDSNSDSETDSDLGSDTHADTETDTDTDTDTDSNDAVDNLDTPGRSPTFRDRLASCFVEHNISNTAIDSILGVLRQHHCLSYLPKCARTLLQTPRQAVELRAVEPGEYLHLGVEVAIVNILSGVKTDSIPEFLEIDVSTDGATIDRTGHNNIWPIQCRVANLYPSKTELIGVYRGKKKPASAMEFLHDFVVETKKIFAAGGVVFNGKRIPMILRCFIADAPARAFILNHIGHRAYRPCSKCKVEGCLIGRNICYIAVENEPRTDEDYSNMLDEDHHKGPSPLSDLQMGLVSQVPFDYMHLICIGVVKKILLQLSTGKFSMLNKLSARQTQQISNRLRIIGSYYPQEMARCPITLEDIGQMKATQGRQFLLYNGPVVLCGIVSPETYEHFLLLHAAMRALVIPSQPALYYKFAELALSLFVRRCPALYGDKFMSYNLHGLLHVVDDVKRYGPPDNYSSFPYENNIKILKKYCKKPNLTLQQIANRRAARASCIILPHEKNENPAIKASGEHTTGRLPVGVSSNVRQYRRLKSGNHTLTLNKRDQCVILKNNCVCLVHNIIMLETLEYSLVVQKFSRIESFYDVGMPSTSLGFFKCSALQNDLVLIPYSDVQSKGYLMPYWDPRNIDATVEQPLDGHYIVGAMSNTVYY